MAKQSGLGDNFYIDGYDLSGDVNALTRIGLAAAVLDMTAIDKSAMERVHGLADGEISFTTLFNDAAAQEHAALKVPRSQRIVSYCRGTALGNSGAGLAAKQFNYDPTRDAEGNLIIAVQTLADRGNPLEWGVQGTAGKRTDTTATNGASTDKPDSAASTNGLAIYAHLFAFTGTSVTIKVQESSDDAVGDPFADVAGATTGALSVAPNSARIVTAAGLAVERYLRVVTTGTFSNAVFAVLIVRL